MTTTAEPTRDSIVTLRPITKDNWRAITQLSVLDAQRGNVSSNVLSICEAHYSEDAWIRGVYADDVPVGFLMMSIWDPDAWYAIWRFMIDRRYQGKGFGAAAVRLAVEHVRREHGAAKMVRLMSAGVEGKKDVAREFSPHGFYAGLGWKDISGLDENGEVEMGLDL